MIATGRPDTESLETVIKAQAYGLGFDLVGVARLGSVGTADHFARWLKHGYAGDMTYLSRGAEKRTDTRLPFEGVQSAIVVALDYGGREPAGPVARYARGDDYHDVIVDRLNDVHRWIEGRLERTVRGKAYVDTGPILERDLARLAGLGWFGKNTMLINPRLGSFFFLGALFIDLALQPDAPFESEHCGSCTRCLDACPTGALVEPHILDATRCISYLTIELKGDIPQPLQASVGDLMYGCDICQDVCPWNMKFAHELGEPAFAPRPAIAGRDARALASDIAAMDDESFRTAFKDSPMKRAKLRGLKRNAAVVLDNVAAAGDGPRQSAASIVVEGSRTGSSSNDL